MAAAERWSDEWLADVLKRVENVSLVGRLTEQEASDLAVLVHRLLKNAGWDAWIGEIATQRILEDYMYVSVLKKGVK